MLIRSFRDSRRAGGFTLVELMVALVVGLIVVLAAVGFVVSVAKANSENIQVTRLTQELRALTEVIARDIRRARYVVDPAGLVGAGALAINHDAISSVSPTASPLASCIQFSYDNPPSLPNATLSHRIRLVGDNVELKTNATPPTPNGPCSNSTDGTEVNLNSSEIRITGLAFKGDSSSDPNSVEIMVRGQLRNAPAGSDLAAIERVFRETVYIRSGPVN